MKISQNRQLTIATGGGQILAPAPKRCGLIFWPCGATYYSIDTTQPASANVGCLINTNTGPVMLDEDTHGTIVKQGWFGISNGGLALPITVTEVFEDAFGPLKV